MKKILSVALGIASAFVLCSDCDLSLAWVQGIALIVLSIVLFANRKDLREEA